MKVPDAKEALFRAPHTAFVTERKRLAGEVKKAGHKEEAAAFLKLLRPSVSAWAVNQLWWVERETFDTMLATAQKVRKGDLGVMAEHKAALARLRARAAELLVEAGNAAADATLHRIGFTLSAIAARGDFGDSEPGMLSEDLEAPGFASLGIVSAPPPEQEKRTAKKREEAAVETKAADEQTEREADEEAAAKQASKEEKEREAEARRKVAQSEKEREQQEAHNAKEARERAEREKQEAAKLQAVAEAAEAAEAVEAARADVERLEAELVQSNKRLESAKKHLDAAKRRS